MKTLQDVIINDELLERDVEMKFKALMKGRGAITRKFVSPSTRGATDQIVIYKGGVVHFVEIKRRSGALTVAQQREQGKLLAQGCAVYTLYGIRDVVDYVQSEVVQSLI